MALSKEVCLPAVKCPFKPFSLFFFIHISHRVFVELVTYYMSVPRAGEESRQRLNLPPLSPSPEISGVTKCQVLCATPQSTHLERLGRHGYFKHTSQYFLSSEQGGTVLAVRKLRLTSK